MYSPMLPLVTSATATGIAPPKPCLPRLPCGAVARCDSRYPAPIRRINTGAIHTRHRECVFIYTRLLLLALAFATAERATWLYAIRHSMKVGPGEKIRSVLVVCGHRLRARPR